MSDLDMLTSEMIARLRTSSRRDDQYTATRLEQQQAEIERLTALRKEDREDMQRLSDQLDYLSDENAKLQALIPPSRPVVICADCKSLEAALTRIATMPPVNEEFGYQGYDADKMAAIARDALEGEK